MDLFTHLTSKSHLYLSFRKAYRGRRKRGDVIRYHFALERHLHDLQRRLRTFSYVHRPYHRFIIEDSKRRVINSPCFEDHILHHALYSLLYQVFDTIFIAHSYGNRVGKGSHKAVQALRRRLRSERFSWFMKCDISKYFQSVDHEILYGQIARRITDSRFLFYVALVINSYEEPKQWFHFLSDVPERRFSAMFSSKGMPIGNVTSQLFANIYLHDLDFYVEHTLKPAVRKCGRDIFYIRYVDDFIVLGETKEDLVWCYGEIQRFLEEALLLYLVPRKVVLNRCRSGIPFLGYVVWSDKVKVRQASLQRFVRNTKDKSHDARVLSLLSFYGHCQYTTTELFPLLVSQLIFQVSETNIYKSEVLEKLLCMEQKTGAEDRSRRQEQKTGVKNHSLFSSSKTISPVVATALILVVAVVSVVGFQGWFQQYSSSLQGEIEQQGGVASITVQDVIQDRVFIKSSEKTNISSVSLNGNQCSLNDSELQEGLNERKLRCGSAVSAGTAEVVLSTSSGVYSTSHYVESSVFCPEGYVRVPHDDYFTQKDFCVMKWEAKAKNTSSGDIVYDGCGGLDNLTACNSGGTSNWADLSVHEPASTAEGAPWRRISMTNAYTACSNLGSDYHLITNREWMTIARNVENNPKNWDNGAVGNSTLPRGLHSVSGSWTDYNPAPNGSSSCRHADGTSNDINCYGDGDFIDKRSLTLSNGEEVWDLSGNVWDWVDANENGTGVSTGNACSGSDAWYEFTSCTFQNGYAKTGASDTKFEVGPEGAFNANDGMGRIYSDSASNRAFRRGGNWRNGALAGAFALNLGNAPSHSYTRIGFRCSYAP